jgi:hypothetical protein
MADVPAWVPIVSALAGGGLVGIVNFAMRWQDRKAEEKRHLQELMFKTAVEEWKQHCTLAIETMKAGRKTAIEPLVTYLIHLMKLSEMLIDGKITKENVSEKLAEVHEVTKAVKEFTALPKKEKGKNNAEGISADGE